MASFLSLHLSPIFSNAKHCELEDSLKLIASSRLLAKNDGREQTNFEFSRSNLAYGSTFRHYSSMFQVSTSRLLLSRALSSTISSPADSDQTISENKISITSANDSQVDFNRVNCLVWVLHESARSFSQAIQELGLSRKEPELAMAWLGVDAQAWHKQVAYQVAIYALLKAVIEVELFLFQKRSSNPSPVQEILSQLTISLGESIESQLKLRQPKLVQWFRSVELPRIAGLFIPLFKKWVVDYAGSGVAGIVLAISCCAAAKKIGSGRISSPSFAVCIEDVLVELMDLSHSLVSVDKLHLLATEAGYEDDFLVHFGRKVLPGKDIEEVEFWIGLVQRKLTIAFHRESIISGKKTFSNEVQEKGLATLGLFAFLGRQTRLFLSRMGVKDLDEQVKDFLSYLECGSLFMHPEFSSLSEYQLFMEVVTDEIGWLDFYAAFSTTNNQEKRSKQHALQAEQELSLYIVFTVCYDVFSGFAHFSSSAKQQLDANLLDFFLRSQTLLSTCLEDYWAVYDRSSELPRITDRATAGSSQSSSSQTNRRTNSSALLEARSMPIDVMTSGSHQQGSKLSKIIRTTELDPKLSPEVDPPAELEPLPKRLLRKSTVKFMSTSADVLMGTQLLFIDVLAAMGYLLKQLRGGKITKRERKKIERTLSDLASLVPITIFMLIPVSAVGHAAGLAAIKKYTPSMIPSPYSSERLNVVKQLKRAKKMEIQAISSTALNKDASSS